MSIGVTVLCYCSAFLQKSTIGQPKSKHLNDSSPGCVDVEPCVSSKLELRDVAVHLRFILCARTSGSSSIRNNFRKKTPIVPVMLFCLGSECRIKWPRGGAFFSSSLFSFRVDPLSQ